MMDDKAKKELQTELIKRVNIKVKGHHEKLVRNNGRN